MSTLWHRRKVRRATLLLSLHQAGPAQVFAELLWIRQQTGRKPGWASHCFREIFGGWPRPRVAPAPVSPSFDLQEWLTIRPKKSRARRHRAMKEQKR
jgi:hypothetical protein